MAYFVFRARYKVSPMVEESKIKCEFRAFCSDAVVVGRDGKLAAEVADGFIIEGDSQFQFDSHPSFAVAEIPDTFTQNGIHHRSNLTLSSSVTTRQSSNKFGFALALAHEFPHYQVEVFFPELLF